MTVLNSAAPEVNTIPEYPEKPSSWYVPATFMAGTANYMVQYLPPAPPSEFKRGAWFHILTAPSQLRTFGLLAYYMLFAPILLLVSLILIAPIFWGGVMASLVGIGILFIFFALYFWKALSQVHLWFMKVFVNFTNIDDLESERVNIGIKGTLSSRVAWIGCVAYQLVFPILWLFAFFFIKFFFLMTCASFALTVVKIGAPAFDPLDDSIGTGLLFGRKGALFFLPTFVMSLYCCTWSACVIAHIERSLAFKMFTHKVAAEITYQLMGNTMTAVSAPRMYDRTATKRVCRCMATVFWFFTIVLTMVGAIHIGLNLRCTYVQGEHKWVDYPTQIIPSHAKFEQNVDEIIVDLKKLRPMCYWFWSHSVATIAVQYGEEQINYPYINGTVRGIDGIGLKSKVELKGSTAEFSVMWAEAKLKYHRCSVPRFTLFIPRNMTLKNLHIKGAAVEYSIIDLKAENIKVCIKRGHLRVTNVTASSLTAKVKKGLISIKGGTLRNVNASMKKGQIVLRQATLIGNSELRINKSGNVFVNRITIGSDKMIDGTNFGSDSVMHFSTEKGEARINGLNIPGYVKFNGSINLEARHESNVHFQPEFPYQPWYWKYSSYSQMEVSALNVTGFSGVVSLPKGTGQFSLRNEAGIARHFESSVYSFGNEGKITIHRFHGSKNPLVFSNYEIAEML